MVEMVLSTLQDGLLMKIEGKRLEELRVRVQLIQKVHYSKRLLQEFRRHEPNIETQKWKCIKNRTNKEWKVGR